MFEDLTRTPRSVSDNLARMSKRIRLKSLELTVEKQKGHLGGTFSCVDLLVALYYGGILNISSANYETPYRNRFILSKGHACLALYSILVDLGILSEERFQTYGDNGGLGGQIDTSIPGVDWNTGSLGHSVGVCCGMAYASKLDESDYKVYTIIGDAECDEGSIWEGIMFAADYSLDNLTCIVDRNRLSVTDFVEDNALFLNFNQTMKSFGWEVYDIDGHDFSSILPVLKSPQTKPRMIMAHTIKGKGVSFMENEPKWHHSVPSLDQLEIARRELS